MKKIDSFSFPSSHQTIIKTATFIDSVHRLEGVYIQKIIQKILFGEAPTELTDWIAQAKTSFIFRQYSNEDLAFYWLTIQKKTWLGNYKTTISELWLNCWLKNIPDVDHESVILRIKSLVENANCGISITKLESYLEEFEEKGLVLAEVDTLLLIAKVEEFNESLSPSSPRWSSLKEEFKNKPYLAVVYLYIHRKGNQQNFSQTLFELSDIHNSDINYYKFIFEELKPYFTDYMVHGVFFNLQDASDKAYKAFRGSINTIQSDWMSQIINQSLEAPGLEQIKQRVMAPNDITHSDQRLAEKKFEQSHQL